MSQEHSAAGREGKDAEEVLSYWFPGDAARTPGAHHRPGPVLPKRLPRLATLLLTGRGGPQAGPRRHRVGDGPRVEGIGADVLLAADRPLRGSCPPRAQRPPRRGGSSQRSAGPRADVRVRGLL